jgi:hypothetical protein
MADMKPAEEGREDVEVLIFLAGGPLFALTVSIVSSTDAGDKRFSTCIDDFRGM